MRLAARALIAAVVLAAVAGLAAAWLVNPDLLTNLGRPRPKPEILVDPPETSVLLGKAGTAKPSSPTPEIYLDPSGLEDGGASVASRFTGPIGGKATPDEIKAAVNARFPRGLEALKAEYGGLKLDDPPTAEQVAKRVGVERSLGLLYMYGGKFTEAAEWTEKALDDAKAHPKAVSAKLLSEMTAVRGVIALRRGEVENCLGCLGPSACIFPIAVEAMHKDQSGSTEAVRWFTDYLEQKPGDLRVLWLLNIAYMTLGKYPEGVPVKYRLPVEMFKSKADVGRFENVAMRVGLDARGPNLAGGSVFDDLTGDGLPDLFSTSLDATKGASLFVNKGDGTFEDRSKAANLDGQVYALNVTRADFDNDGDLDLLMLRGGWEFPARMTLLRNRGDGVFDDVTEAAGLAAPIQTEAAAWGDFDNDGKVDVFVCGEFLGPGAGEDTAAKGDPRNRCRLYHNRGDGTFEDVAPSAGVEDNRCAKGAGWADYDGDGDLDLFVSNMGQPCRLYRNKGDGTFEDVAPALGVTGPAFSFACWFWDYDNDGLFDLYVNDYRASVGESIGSNAGITLEGGSRPALYRNEGKGRFRDVTSSVGLARAMAPMGANFGDIDNDGFPDFYLGTGSMSYAGLDPDLLFHNNRGFRFDDVTTSSGTGHLQKGHGVSFADWDNDGDLDLFVELGGGTPGDQAFNVLFQNPGHEGHSLKVKLVGTTTNRAALGARIKADFLGDGGETRSVYRTVGNNSSFGGNTLVELIGLGTATKATLTITWPTSGTTQTLPDLEAGRTFEVTEGSDTPKDVTLPKLTAPPVPKT